MGNDRLKKAILVLAALLACVSGCAEFLARQPKLDYQKVIADGRAHRRRADVKNRVGLELLKEHNFDGAEVAFQQALIADSSFAPAHNNLGKLYYEQGDNYLAAREFEEARRLTPECPQPINNLGLIYYEVDKFDEAIGYFQQACELDPTNPEYLGNLVRARVRRGDRTYDLREQIEALQLIENRAEWKDWEAEQLAMGGLDNIVVVNASSLPVYHEIPNVQSTIIEPALEPTLVSPEFMQTPAPPVIRLPRDLEPAEVFIESIN